jgi:type II secretory pathway component PulM
MTRDTDKAETINPLSQKLEQARQEIKRLNHLISALETQRNEALTARARGDANQSLLMEALQKANQENENLRQTLADGAIPVEDAEAAA